MNNPELAVVIHCMGPVGVHPHPKSNTYLFRPRAVTISQPTSCALALASQGTMRGEPWPMGWLLEGRRNGATTDRIEDDEGCGTGDGRWGMGLKMK